MAAVAVFIALGGTSWAAITLPRNSVGKRQIKTGAVGAKELRIGAVGSRAVRNGSLEPRDLSSATKALVARPGPPGPPGARAISVRASLNSGGVAIAGSPVISDGSPPNKRFLDFSRDLSGCVPTATLARNAGGATVDPGPGRIVVAVEDNRVVVETFRSDGTPDFLPFNVIVAC